MLTMARSNLEPTCSEKIYILANVSSYGWRLAERFHQKNKQADKDTKQLLFSFESYWKAIISLLDNFLFGWNNVDISLIIYHNSDAKLIYSSHNRQKSTAHKLISPLIQFISTEKLDSFCPFIRLALSKALFLINKVDSLRSETCHAKLKFSNNEVFEDEKLKKAARIILIDIGQNQNEISNEMSDEGLINLAVSAQSQRIPIDTCSIYDDGSGLLSSLAEMTEGLYLNISNIILDNNAKKMNNLPQLISDSHPSAQSKADYMFQVLAEFFRVMDQFGRLNQYIELESVFFSNSFPRSCDISYSSTEIRRAISHDLLCLPWVQNRACLYLLLLFNGLANLK